MMRITAEFAIPEMTGRKMLQISVMADPELMSLTRVGMSYTYEQMAYALIKAVHS